jgi:hypothetical protein
MVEVPHRSKRISIREDLMSMRRVLLATSIALTSLTASTIAFADPKDDLNEALKNTDFCAPLKFDAKEILAYLKIPVPPLLPGATTIGIDKEAHKVKSLSGSPGGKLASQIEVGCKPSDQSVVVKLAGGDADRFRITDNADCAGSVQADYSVPDVQCKISGEGAKFLGKIERFDDKMKPLFQAALKPK